MLFSVVVDAVRYAAMAAQLERLGVRVVLKPFDLELRLAVPAEALANRTTMDQRRFLTALLRRGNRRSGRVVGSLREPKTCEIGLDNAPSWSHRAAKD